MGSVGFYEKANPKNSSNTTFSWSVAQSTRSLQWKWWRGISKSRWLKSHHAYLFFRGWKSKLEQYE